jgi:hypothetical protein
VNKNFKEYMRYLGNYKNQIVDKFSAKAKECKYYGKRDNYLPFNCWHPDRRGYNFCVFHGCPFVIGEDDDD